MSKQDRLHSRVVRLMFIGLILLLLGFTARVFIPLVSAQGGETKLNYNDPAIVTLAPGQTVTQTFTALAGDRLDIRLSPLTDFTYTAFLIDPTQNSVPLAPGPDGNTQHVVDSVAVGGTYSLVLQATNGTGELLIRIYGTAVAQPTDLALGQTPFDLLDQPVRFRLIPPTDTGDTLLTVNVIVPEGAPAVGLPALTLTRQDSGQTVLTTTAGTLPQVSAILPAQTAFLLYFDPGSAPLDMLITWVAAAGDDTGPTPTVCQVSFSGPVNVRTGPSTFYSIIGVANVGITLPVTGRNENTTWWQVNFNNLPGWVSGELATVQVAGNCSNAPFVSVPPPPPTFTPTPVGTASETPISTVDTETPTVTPTGDTLTPSWTPTWTETMDETWTPTWTPTVTDTWTVTWTPTVTDTWTATWTPAPDAEPPTEES